MSTMTSPFTRAVVSSMRKLYPEALADKSFDNTGLLLEAPFDPLRRQMNSVLLTIDLTKAVAEEAMENNCSVVVAYHPIIFRGLKSITFADSQQSTLLRLVSEGISVYCPHTAVDTVPGGMADWLCDIVTGKLDAPEPETHTATVEEGGEQPSDTDTTTSEDTSTSTSEPPSTSADEGHTSDSDPFTTSTPQPNAGRPNLKRAYSKPTYPIAPSPTYGPLHPAATAHTRSVIHPSPESSISAANTYTNSTTYSPSNTGAGRLLKFHHPQPLPNLIERIARGVGTPKGFPVAIPQSAQVEDLHISTCALCPGSGSHVLANTTADLLFTGELPHHDALAHTERGGCVVTLFHSNSERGYLHSVMRTQLETELRREWGRVRDEIISEGELSEDIEGVVNDDEVRVWVSERDRDPYGIVVLNSEVEGEKI